MTTTEEADKQDRLRMKEEFADKLRELCHFAINNRIPPDFVISKVFSAFMVLWMSQQSAGDIISEIVSRSAARGEDEVE